MRIGIPRALLYYYYYPLWKVFFEALDMEVVTSQKTRKEQVDKGVKVSVSDICVPIKIFNGHLVELLHQEDVNYIFVPRMMHIRKGEFFCPKFMGLPDMVRHSIDGAEDKLLFPNMESRTDDISHPKNYLEMCEPLGISERKLKKALKEGQQAWREFYNFCKKGYTAAESIEYVLEGKVPEKYDEPIMKFGLLGYVYDIYDEFVSMGIVDRLREMNIEIETFEMIDEIVLDNQLKNMKKRLFWTFSNKLIAAGYKFLKDPSIDGIIHVTAFGCGPDSLIGKVMELESTEYKKPFMTIRVDEHTGENHLQTRVQAFVDMIYRKKYKVKERGIV